MAGRLRLGEALIAKGLLNKRQLDEALEDQKKRGGFLGQILIEKGYVSSSEIRRTVGELSTQAGVEYKLAQALVSEKIITPEQLEKAREKQKSTHQHLTDTLIDLDFITPVDIAKTIGKLWNIPFISLSEKDISNEALQLLSEEMMRRHFMIPVRIEDNTLVLAMADPLNIVAVDEVRLMTNYQVKVTIATERDITLILDKYFNIQRTAKEALLGMKIDDLKAPLEKEIEAEQAVHQLDAGPVIKLVDTIIDGGINAKASDIHLEPQEFEMRVRYRIDGILHDILKVPRGVEASVISRIKVLADMNIAERRQPQDGHIAIKKDSKEYDLRVSSFPTVGGEKVVLRILDKSSMLLSLDELGMTREEQHVFQTMISRAYGIILVTGPTGGGKTTTLYAALNKLNTLTKNIITVEDPVEYKLEGINQSQINVRAGLTFATGLRAILRQDPDIIMVGEIRDLETAEIAIRAALTGHLVFSTLHTGDATSAITRLLDMGIESFLIASSIIGIMAQRLVRTICVDCKKRYTPGPEVIKELGLDRKGKCSFAKGNGCHYCIGTGYKGRVGVFELMQFSEGIKDLIGKRASASAIKAAAVKEGMNTLRASALKKVLEGVTTFDEAKRVVFAEG